MPPRSSIFPLLLSWSAAALWAGLVPLWLLAARGHGAPEGVARAVLPAALAATAGALALAARRALARDRRSALLLFGLLALSLAVRFAGIEHEVAERYYLDEGTYARHATDINRGELLVPTFVYPHLLYYLDAFAIWLASLLGGLTVGATSALYDISDWPVVCRLVMRSVSALLGALTVVPVYALARSTGRLAGLGGRGGPASPPAPTEELAAAAFAALLLVFSPLYNEGSHLAICDVPSAFFAAVTVACCARLLEREQRSGYLWAGAASGLAAGAKYPAGLVAVAIVAVWLRWRLRERRWRGGLLWAGGASLAAFLASNPSLLFLPRLALSGDRGIFFGVFQYAGEGWLGVVPEHPALYYLGTLAESFGWPALAAGALGLALLLRNPRGRTLLWLAAFPATYLGLLLTMTVAVKRNVYPALPPLAGLLGVGAVALVSALLARLFRAPAEGRGRPWIAGTALALLLAVPGAAAFGQTVAFSRPGTRVLAREWVRTHVPRGATILKDDYTPDFDPGEYAAWRPKGIRFLGQVTEEQRKELGWDLILVSAASYGRFFAPSASGDPEAVATRERYRRIFDSAPPLARFEPGPFRDGPALALYRETLASAPPATGALLQAGDAFVPDGAMRPKHAAEVRFTLDGQWLLFRVRLQPGRYLCRLAGSPAAGGDLRLLDLGNRELARAEVAPDGTALLDVPGEPSGENRFLYLHFPRGSAVATLTLAPAG